MVGGLQDIDQNSPDLIHSHLETVKYCGRIQRKELIIDLGETLVRRNLSALWKMH